jgi:caffeoyl-CoA O-methyltransferase
MHEKFTRLDAGLYEYLVAHCTPPDPLALELTRETQALGDLAVMQTAHDQAALLAMLVRISGARRAIEIGTFTGYSSLAVARALPDGGTLLCCDREPQWTAIAERYWRRAGVADKITLRLDDATDTLAALPAGERFDFAFIDADKGGYLAYFEAILERMDPGGLVTADNVLWMGTVSDPAQVDPTTNAIRDFNDRLAADARVDVVILPVGDGLTVARKR